MLIKFAILDYDTQPLTLAGNALFHYNGPKRLSSVTALEIRVDTSDSSLSDLGEMFPRLEKLKLNNSKIDSVRDIGCHLDCLRVLLLANCGITSLNGISTIARNLEELHLAFNAITDVSDLMGMDKLRVLDLEGNQISDLSNLRFLTCCTALTSVTLAGNPAVKSEDAYVKIVAELIPNLMYLDERRVRACTFSTEEVQESVRLDTSRTFSRTRNSVKEVERPPEQRLATAMIMDKVNDRPPSARGRGLKEKISATGSCAKIVRPVSSSQRMRMNAK
jgi:hypothetical protein